MTISATYTPAQANGNDVAVAFPFAFKTFAQADLVVILTDALGVNTTQVITTDYTVALNADQNNNPGGTVTMITAPATGETLIITRVLQELQETDITNGGGFYPEVVENALDRVTMLNQQNTATTNRALVAPLAEASIDTLPSIVDRASKYLAFDAEGQPVATSGTANAFVVTAFAETLLDDANAAAMRETLGSTAVGDAVFVAATEAAARAALGITAGAVPHLPIINGYIEWSIGANALVAAVKTLAGADPSAGDPVYAVFRDATLTTSGYYVRSITAALSVTASSGSTLGTVSGQASRIRAVLVDDGGTVVLGLYNPWHNTNKSLVGLNEGAVYSTTAEGGAGAADSAQVIYTTAAKTSKAIREVAYVDSTQATAGTWATALTNEVQITATTPKTGAVLQIARSVDGAVATGTTIIPFDDTIPQNTEGDQYMSQAITPQAAANLLEIAHTGTYANSSVVGSMAAALFQDATAAAIAAAISGRNGAAAANAQIYLDHVMPAGTVSSTTFKLRAGFSGAGTTTFNGSAGARYFGGSLSSFLQVKEIMA